MDTSQTNHWPWHAPSPGETPVALWCGPDGLAPGGATRRRAEHGQNGLTRGPVASLLVILMCKIANPLCLRVRCGP